MSAVRAAALLLALSAARLPAQRWLPDERVLVTDFSSVVAVAASPALVFGATTRGLVIYDLGARAWRPPVSRLDGYPRAAVRAALADVAANAVWLATADGWARYDVDLRTWQAGSVPGGAHDLALDAADVAGGVFLREARGWTFLPAGALLPVPRALPPAERRIQPLTPEAALQLAPVADAMRALILTDVRLRTHAFTSACRSPDGADLFFGTTGMGIVRIDGVTAQWERLGFGLAVPGASALAADVDGVWAGATVRAGERQGLTWVRTDLSEVQAVERAGALGFPFRTVRSALARGPALWLATERGVVRLDPRSLAARTVASSQGLPADDALSLAPAPDGVWAGTSRGLAVIDDSGAVTAVGELALPVPALLAVRETLWVGTGAGLRLLAPGAPRSVVPQGTPAALREPIVSLARTADTIVAATRDQLAWRDPVTGAWTVERPLADLGMLTTLAGDAGGVWVGGTAGLAFWDIGRRTFGAVRVPRDVPATVRDVAAAAQWIWVATDSGVVRFARRAIVDR